MTMRNSQILSVLAMSAVATMVAGCATLAGTSSTRTASGRFVCAEGGSGLPVVVFEAGAGDGMESWAKVLPEIQGFASTFAYSRRGHGGSLPPPLRRNGSDVVKELRELLKARGARPPYVLVGHSIGGLYMELFAKLHPEEVAALVLVDATHPDHLEGLRLERPTSYHLVQTAMTLNTLNPLGAELRGIQETAREWHAAGPLPQCPTILLTATKSRLMDGKDFAQFTARLQTELVHQWPGAEQRLVDATHYIQNEKPEIVIATIREVVERVRRARGVSSR